MLALQDGPTVVAGHSYGGQVITALGTHAPNVVGLVYIAAIGIDKGESLGGLLSQGPPTPALVHQFVDEQGFVWLTEDDFVNHFASGVDPVKAKVLHAVQQPPSASVLRDVLINAPAWKSLPSWYLVAQDDQALPPDAQRMFADRIAATTFEVERDTLAEMLRGHGEDGLTERALTLTDDELTRMTVRPSAPRMRNGPRGADRPDRRRPDRRGRDAHNGAVVTATVDNGWVMAW